MAADRAAWLRLHCPAADLRVGDEVFTPYWRWETVTAVAAGSGFPRRVKVTTDATGTELPWQVTADHRFRTRRRPVSTGLAVAA